MLYSNSVTCSTPSAVCCFNRIGPFRQWDCVGMEKAVAEVEKGVSVRRAAEMFGVPRSTLHDRIPGKVRIGGKPDRTPYLSDEEEEELVSFLLKCADIGYAHTRKEVLAIVQRIVDQQGGRHVLSNGWWARFCDRHPQLTLGTTMPLPYARALATISHHYHPVLRYA